MGDVLCFQLLLKEKAVSVSDTDHSVLGILHFMSWILLCQSKVMVGAAVN